MLDLQSKCRLVACVLGVSATSLAAGPGTSPVPASRIMVEPLGFVPPAAFFTPYRIPSTTLDFLDDTHLLFTFHVAKLMRREKDEPPEDQDQLIRAVVLSVPTGKIESEGTWRMHDRDRYLWMLRDGHFLMRQRNTLYIGDKSLVMTTWLHPEGKLATVQLSPDASTLVAEFAKEKKLYDEDGNRVDAGPTLGDDAPRFPEHPSEYSMIVVDTHEHSAKRVGTLRHPVVLPMVEGGYLGVEQGSGKEWQVSINSFGGEHRIVTKVVSPCQPTVEPVSQHAFLVRSCLPFSSDRLVDAFDIKGNKLWEQIWQSRFAWGNFSYSLSENRFAYSSIEVNHSLAPLDPIDQASILGQPVGVFDVQTGKPEVVLDASPILTAGNNFALSPDGETFAVLRAGAIEVYSLGAKAPVKVATASAASSVASTPAQP